jgi:hypothetical protein
MPGREWARTAVLALKLARAARVRLTLSVLLVALAMTVFLVVTQLAQIGSQGLDDAIDAESGAQGTYAIETQSTFGLGRDTFLRRVTRRLEPMSVAPLTYVVGYPDVQPECPPYDVIGSGMVRFVYEADGAPYPLRFGGRLPVDTEVCLAGAAVPASAIFVPSQADKDRWGDGLTLSPAFEPAAALMTAEPVAYRFVVTTGRADSIPALRAALETELAGAAARFGTTVDDTTISLGRLDRGEQVRAASQGIRTIFGVLGWGVLLLGALGLLVSQLIVVRDRMWLFGLSVALGARRQHVAILVGIEVLATVVLGVLTAVALALASQPLANRIARSTFDVDADLVNPAVLPRLVLGALLVLVVASGWPAYRATTQDPLDVLEPPVS